MEKLNAYCFALIKACRETNADTMKLTQENVSYLGEQIGTWRITVEKISPPLNPQHNQA